VKASSLLLVVPVIALAPMASAYAQATPKPVAHHKREKAVRQVKDQSAGQIFCKRNVPCRPVQKGCHLEPQCGGFNEEVCNLPV
jgi:hypothetical protein